MEAPGRIGQWSEGGAPATGSGPCCWINVDDIDQTLALAGAHGGQVLESQTQDGGVRWMATISDTAATPPDW